MASRFETLCTRWTKATHRYVVGYAGAGNVIYGLPETGPRYIKPFTLRQAEQFLKQMPCAGAMIFELRPVAHNG